MLLRWLLPFVFPVSFALSALGQSAFDSTAESKPQEGVTRTSGGEAGVPPKGNLLPNSENLGSGDLIAAAKLEGLGMTSTERGDLSQAEDFLLQALAIRQTRAPASLGLASTLNKLGTVEWQRGDLTKAEEYFRQAFQILNTLVPGTDYVAYLLNNLALIAYGKGDLVEADLYHRRHLISSDSLTREVSTLPAA